MESPGWDNRVPFQSPSRGKPITRAIVTWQLAPVTFFTPTIQFPPILAALKAVPPQTPMGKVEAGLTFLSSQLRAEDGQQYPVHHVLGKGGCWGGPRTVPQMLVHFHLSVCWETWLLKAKGEK